jgi:hypothetical protein
MRALVCFPLLAAAFTLASTAALAQAPPAGAPAIVPVGLPVQERTDPTAPVPYGYHEEKRTRRGLVVAGSVLFAAMYTPVVVGGIAEASNGGGDRKHAVMAVPVVGPIVELGNIGSCSYCGPAALALAGLVIDGIAQGAGLVMLIVGIARPETVLVRNDAAALRVVPVPSVQVGARGGALTWRF